MAKQPPAKPKTPAEKYGQPAKGETPAQKLGKAVPIFGRVADALSGKGAKKPAKK